MIDLFLFYCFLHTPPPPQNVGNSTLWMRFSWQRWLTFIRSLTLLSMSLEIRTPSRDSLTRKLGVRCCDRELHDSETGLCSKSTLFGWSLWTTSIGNLQVFKHVHFWLNPVSLMNLNTRIAPVIKASIFFQNIFTH